jgi:predicted PurR-regulated permease PerM
MFTLPSLWNLIISTAVFIIAARYLQHYLELRGLPKGMTRSTLVFTLASLLSWGSGEMVDWTQDKVQDKPPVAQAPDDLSQLLKLVGQLPPENKEPVSN